jgi:hypothetical protein
VLADVTRVEPPVFPDQELVAVVVRWHFVYVHLDVAIEKLQRLWLGRSFEYLLITEG